MLQTLEEGGTEKVVVVDDGGDHGGLVVVLVALLLQKKTLHSSSSKTLEASTFLTEPRLNLSGVASLDPFCSWNMLICHLLPHGTCCADQRPFFEGKKEKKNATEERICVFDINKCLFALWRV